MKTDADTPAAVIDRPAATWLAWAALGAVLAMLALEARDAALRSAKSAPVIEVEDSKRVIVGIPLDDLASPAGLVIPATVAVARAVSTDVQTTVDTRGLVGMPAADLRAMLGTPDFVRRDGRSQMWRYGSGACTLTVFLHGSASGLAVEHVEGRGVRSARDTGADCGERLVGERRLADLPG